MAQASTSGKPKRASNGAWFLRSTPAPKPQRIACVAVGRRRAARSAASPASRRGSARSSRALSRTLCHQVFGWKRSSWTRQPPATSTTIVENAIAFTWLSGSGVMTRSVSRRMLHTPPSAGVPLAGAQEVGVAQHAALGPAGGARGVEQRAFGVAGRSGSWPRCARGACARAAPAIVGAPSSSSGTPACARGRAQVVGALRQRDGQADLAVADQVDRARPSASRH